MAWGTLRAVSGGWVNAFTSGKYATDNYVKYQIDESSRKLRVIVTRQRVRSLDSAYSYSGNVNNGCKFDNGDNDSQYPRTFDTEDTISVPGGGFALIPSNSDKNIGAVYTYNDDGSVPSITLSTQMIFDLSGYDKTTYKFSNQDWKSQELKSKFPEISPKNPDPVTDLKVTNVTANSISVSFTASADAVKYKIRAIVMEDGTIANMIETTETYGTVNRLKSGETYLINVSAIDSDDNESDFTNVANITTLTTLTGVGIKINVGGVVKKGIVYINVSGNAKKAKSIYVNVNGVAKKVFSL